MSGVDVSTRWYLANIHPYRPLSALVKAYHEWSLPHYRFVPTFSRLSPDNAAFLGQRGLTCSLYVSRTAIGIFTLDMLLHLERGLEFWVVLWGRFGLNGY